MIGIIEITSCLEVVRGGFSSQQLVPHGTIALLVGLITAYPSRQGLRLMKDTFTTLELKAPLLKGGPMSRAKSPTGLEDT
jgi:hypothetical protein